MGSEVGSRLDMWSKICNATLAEQLTIIMREYDRLILQITTYGDDTLSKPFSIRSAVQKCVNGDVAVYCTCNIDDRNANHNLPIPLLWTGMTS